jgi:RNA recognition motif-containing protein
MTNKIYVGNLSYEATSSELENKFAEFGEVLSARIITDRYTNQSKGFGFVEMSDGSSAQAAISALNGQEWLSRAMKVNEAQSRERR